MNKQQTSKFASGMGQGQRGVRIILVLAALSMFVLSAGAPGTTGW